MRTIEVGTLDGKPLYVEVPSLAEYMSQLAPRPANR